MDNEERRDDQVQGAAVRRGAARECGGGAAADGLVVEGLTCVEAGSGRRSGLEIDHVDPVAHHGPTAWFNLEPRCWPHHQAKTERDRQAGLLGVRERQRSGPRRE